MRALLTNPPQEYSDVSATPDVAEIPELEAYANVWASTKVLPYSFPSVGPRADPGVQTVSPQGRRSHRIIGGHKRRLKV